MADRDGGRCDGAAHRARNALLAPRREPEDVAAIRLPPEVPAIILPERTFLSFTLLNLKHILLTLAADFRYYIFAESTIICELW